MQRLGMIVAALVVGLVLCNALFMLFSPSRWFRLPRWLRATGTLTEKRGQTVWGDLEIRLCGLVMLLGIGWVIRDAFFQ
jgi:hypothetical protein